MDKIYSENQSSVLIIQSFSIGELSDKMELLKSVIARTAEVRLFWFILVQREDYY